MEELQLSNFEVGTVATINEEGTTLTQEVVEVAKEQAVDPLDTPELNRAAFEFDQLFPSIKGYSKNMNAKGVARVLIAVVGFPLVAMPKFKAKAENELFMMCMHAMGHKQTMTNAVFKNQQDMKELQDKAVNNTVEEILNEKKEVVNELEETGQSTQG